MRTLVTHMARSGLCANENAGAVISMIARSTTRSNQAAYIDARPQSRQIDENLLRRTAGPYIRVMGRPLRLRYRHDRVYPR
jgi:hypothetical protein